MRPMRSVLFVPGHKEGWPDKAVAAGADGVILDLEDAVPIGMKAEAREIVANSIRKLDAGSRKVGVYVRLNALETGMTGDDLEHVAIPGLSGVLLPKNYGPRDIIACDALITHFERRNGVTPGTIEIVVSLETAQAYAQCEDILAASPRVATLFAGTAKDADVSRSIGFQFTPAGTKRSTCAAARCWRCARAAASSRGSDSGRTSRTRTVRAHSRCRIASSASRRW